MSLIKNAIKRPVATSMFFVGLVLLGLYAFDNNGVSLLPDISLPHLIIQTSYSNATPEEVEQLVTRPIESIAGTVTGVKSVVSNSKNGVSVISIDFTWGTNMDFAMLALREKLDNLRFSLPKEAGRPTILRVDPAAAPIMSLVLSYSQNHPRDSYENDLHLDKHSKEKELLDPQFIEKSSDPSEIKRLLELKEAARVFFKRRLEQISGVAQAIVIGGLEPEILIEVDQSKMLGYEITFEEVDRALKASNINLSAGTILNGIFKYSLRTNGEFSSLKDIENTIIKRNPEGSGITLSDFAVVEQSFKEREGFTRINGEETIGILINKESNASTVEVAEKVEKSIDQLNKEYPEFSLAIVSNHALFIQEAISNVRQEILYGGLLAFIVLFVFLGSLRNIIIIGLAIPASLILTFLLMYFAGIKFNLISLGGIALGVGMLLDNAIIVIENVTSYREKGLSSKQSAIIGSTEVSMPIIASTVTTIAVFLPLIFLKGIVGELFKDQSYAVVFSLFASIITALTLIPMLASLESTSLQEMDCNNTIIEIHHPAQISRWDRFVYLLFLPIRVFQIAMKQTFIIARKNIVRSAERTFSRFHAKTNVMLDALILKYERLLELALENKGRVIGLSVLLLVLTLLAFLDMKKELIPASPKDEFILALEFPQGTSLKGNSEITWQIENVLLHIHGVKSVVTNIGRVNELDFLNREKISINKSSVLIKLESLEYFHTVREEMKKIFLNLGMVKYSIKEPENAYSQVIGSKKDDIVIKIKNANLDSAFAKARFLTEQIKLQKLDGLTELRLGTDKTQPEYKIGIDREKCRVYGVSVSEVAQQLVHIVKGTESTFLSGFDKKTAITIKTPETERNTIEEVLSGVIISGEKRIPINAVVTCQLTESYEEIWREDQERTVHIYASVSNGNISNTIKKLNQIIQETPRNAGESISIGGLNEEMQSSFHILYISLIISIILMYIVLSAEFESLLYPFIIIFSIPMGLIGGILTLYLFGESLSIISIMGLVILIGIADNDAVVKLEFILRKRSEGYSVKDAILLAGKNRFRPIVMNSLTVICGLIPVMLGISAGTQLRISLALAIAGGLVTSTILTLIIIPVIYSYAEEHSNKRKNNN